jgi:hypothetical protein
MVEEFKGGETFERIGVELRALSAPRIGFGAIPRIL